MLYCMKNGTVLECFACQNCYDYTVGHFVTDFCWFAWWMTCHALAEKQNVWMITSQQWVSEWYGPCHVSCSEQRRDVSNNPLHVLEVMDGSWADNSVHWSEQSHVKPPSWRIVGGWDVVCSDSWCDLWDAKSRHSRSKGARQEEEAKVPVAPTCRSSNCSRCTTLGVQSVWPPFTCV